MRENVPYYAAFGAAAAGFVSIAASHILLGVAIALLAVRRDLVRIPPNWLPLVLLFAATLVSAAFSDDPAAGWPQVRKFYVWLMLIVVYSVVRTITQVRNLLVALIAGGTASALWGLVQFVEKYQAAMDGREDFYQSYVADRITGFMSHWMTFSSHLMIALLLVAALILLKALPGPARVAGIASSLVLAVAIVAGFTRSIWPAVAVGLLYLIWRWKRWVILTTPVVAAGLFLAAPEPVSRRIESAWNPSKLDSNDHRDALRRTGLRMIAAHPLTGVGPERIEARFLDHAPPDIPRPLPQAWYVKHLHNIYLQFAAERGIPAALALFWFLLQAGWDMLRARPPEEARYVCHAVVACLLGILVGGWWEHNLGDSEVLGALLSVLACGYSVREAES